MLNKLKIGTGSKPTGPELQIYLKCEYISKIGVSSKMGDAYESADIIS